MDDSETRNYFSKLFSVPVFMKGMHNQVKCRFRAIPANIATQIFVPRDF